MNINHVILFHVNHVNCILIDIGVCIFTASYCYGEQYRGNLSTTRTGETCQKWTSIPLASYPDAGLGAGDHNYCRNPGRNPWPEDHNRPWCYVSDDNELEYCDVGDAQTTCLGRFLNRSTIFWKYYNYYFYKTPSVSTICIKCMEC